MCNLCFLCHCTLALCVCVVCVCVCVRACVRACAYMMCLICVCTCVCVCVGGGGGYILVFQCIDHFRLQLMFFGNWFSGLRVGVQHCQPLSAQPFRNGCTQ